MTSQPFRLTPQAQPIGQLLRGSPVLRRRRGVRKSRSQVTLFPVDLRAKLVLGRAPVSGSVPSSKPGQPQSGLVLGQSAAASRARSAVAAIVIGAPVVERLADAQVAPAHGDRRHAGLRGRPGRRAGRRRRRCIRLARHRAAAPPPTAARGAAWSVVSCRPHTSVGWRRPDRQSTAPAARWKRIALFVTMPHGSEMPGKGGASTRSMSGKTRVLARFIARFVALQETRLGALRNRRPGGPDAERARPDHAAGSGSRPSAG